MNSKTQVVENKPAKSKTEENEDKLSELRNNQSTQTEVVLSSEVS